MESLTHAVCAGLPDFLSFWLRIVTALPTPRSYSPYPGGGANPPTSQASNSANVIVVASSQYGPIIWIPTGSPACVRPAGATVAGQPVSVAGAIQFKKSMYFRGPPAVAIVRSLCGSV